MDKAVDRRNIIDDFKGLSQDRIRALYAENATNLIVVIESWKGTLNLGTLIRSANFHGVHRVIYTGIRKRDKRSEVGCANYFPVEYKSLDFIKQLKERYLIVAVDNNIPGVVD